MELVIAILQQMVGEMMVDREEQVGVVNHMLAAVEEVLVVVVVILLVAVLLVAAEMV